MHLLIVASSLSSPALQLALASDCRPVASTAAVGWMFFRVGMH
jgi:hypothetical protein